MRKEPKAIEFTYERTLKLRRPKFALSKNIQYLDPLKLSKGSHTIELGKFEDCGCDCTVSATIKDGMITGIKHPKCKHTQPIPPKLAKALAAARKTFVVRLPAPACSWCWPWLPASLRCALPTVPQATGSAVWPPPFSPRLGAPELRHQHSRTLPPDCCSRSRPSGARTQHRLATTSPRHSRGRGPLPACATPAVSRCPCPRARTVLCWQSARRPTRTSPGCTSMTPRP